MNIQKYLEELHSLQTQIINYQDSLQQSIDTTKIVNENCREYVEVLLDEIRQKDDLQICKDLLLFHQYNLDKIDVGNKLPESLMTGDDYDCWTSNNTPIVSNRGNILQYYLNIYFDPETHIITDINADYEY